jgi:hypothetical protein
MRDEAIVAMHKQSGRRELLIFKQFEFLQTRQEAAERIIKASTIWDRLGFILWPERFFEVVDAMQLSLLQEGQKKMAEARERNEVKSKIQVVPASTILPAGAIH